MRIVWLTALLMVLAAPGFASMDLEGRLGVGVNWQGFQVKYGVTPHWLVEGKVQFEYNNTVAGLRGYRLFEELPRMLMSVRPYLGGEVDWVFSDYLLGGMVAGAFCGLELMPADYLGLEVDAGMYYINLWSGLGNISDLGLVFNAGVTFFF